MTVRQVFYQAESKKLVPKEDSGYRTIQRNILLMRREKIIPYWKVADSSRYVIKPESFRGARDALNKWVKFYKQDVWADKDVHVEIWLEKRSLAGIFNDITSEYDVPLYPSAGFSSDTFIYESVEHISELNKPAYIHFFSDYDLSGMRIFKAVERRIRRMNEDKIDITFERVGLNPWQIELYNLPLRPSKDNTTEFKEGSCELDALHPDDLAALVESCITRHITDEEINKIKMEEEVHLETLRKFRLTI